MNIVVPDFYTPKKNVVALPTQALADAIAVERKTNPKFSSANMPLTLLAYTAIDQISGQEALIIDALMEYVDTDALSYYASDAKTFERQQLLWEPQITASAKALGAAWQTTRGLMPLAQSPALHKGIRQYLESLNAMQLAAASVFASGFSSLLLAIAVMQGQLGAVDAFLLSRLEEETQAEQWGRDAQAQARAERMQTEIVAAERFLHLLQA